MNLLSEGKTKFVFIGVHDQFVINLDIREEELKKRLIHFLRSYEGIKVGTV
jgi:hypothetical protein